MKNITATIHNTDTKIRLKVGKPLKDQYGNQVHDRNWSTGITLDALYVGHRWFVLEYNSIWDNGKGYCVGTHYAAYDLTSSQGCSEILRICELLDIEPPITIKAVEA